MNAYPHQSLNYSADKVGNAIIYIVDSIQAKYLKPVYLTKLLKLLYIIDEKSILETAAPVTGLDYKVWEMGPVPVDLHEEFSRGKTEHFNFFAEAFYDGNGYLIKTVNTFDDAEFSDYEIQLMDRVIEEFGHLDGKALIDLLHEKGGLWDRIVTDKNLHNHFQTVNKTTDISIDFSQKLTDEFAKELYKNSLRSLTI